MGGSTPTPPGKKPTTGFLSRGYEPVLRANESFSEALDSSTADAAGEFLRSNWPLNPPLHAPPAAEFENSTEIPAAGFIYL
jgi:hypothetical protein